MTPPACAACGHPALVHVIYDTRQLDGRIVPIRRRCTSFRPELCLCRLYREPAPQPDEQERLW